MSSHPPTAAVLPRMQRAALAALVVVTVALAALAVVSWPSADDYCNSVLEARLGVLGALEWLYTQWSGRLVTGAVLYGLVAVLDVPSLRVITVVVAASCALLAWQVATFVLDRPSPLRLPLAAALLPVLALGLYPVLGQTLYWPTGAVVYWLPLLVLVHWLAGVRRLLVRGDDRHRVYWWVTSALVGNSIELVLPVAALYLAFAAWRGRAMPRVRRGIVVRAAGLALGAAVLLGAPGNFERARATPGSFDIAPAALTRALGELLAQALDAGRLLIGAITLLVTVTLLLSRRRDPRAACACRDAEALVLVAGGLASLGPLLAAPAQAAPRNALYLLVTLLAAGLTVSVPRWVAREATAIRALAAVAWLVGVVVCVRWADDFTTAAARRGEQLTRHAYLGDPARAGSDVVLAPPRAPAPRTMHAVDITPEPGELVNWCVATYYGLASVRVAPGGVRP